MDQAYLSNNLQPNVTMLWLQSKVIMLNRTWNYLTWVSEKQFVNFLLSQIKCKKVQTKTWTNQIPKMSEAQMSIVNWSCHFIKNNRNLNCDNSRGPGHHITKLQWKQMVLQKCDCLYPDGTTLCCWENMQLFWSTNWFPSDIRHIYICQHILCTYIYKQRCYISRHKVSFWELKRI